MKALNVSRMYLVAALILFVFCLLINTSLGRAEDLSAVEVLAAYRNSVQNSLLHREKCLFKAEEKSVVTGAVYGKAPYETLRRYSIFKDRDRLCRHKQQTQFFGEGQIPMAEKRLVEHKFQFLFDGKRAVSYTTGGNKKNPYALTYTQNSCQDPWFGKLLIIHGVVGIIFEGYMTGDLKPLWEVLHDAPNLQLKDSMEVIDEHETYVLEAKTKHGHHTLWIDPNSGFNARRITVHRRADDLFEGKPLSSPRPKPTGRAIAAYPVVPRKEQIVVLDSVEIENIDGIFIPTAGVVNRTCLYSNGEKVTRRNEYKYFDIDLNPDFSVVPEAFVLDIPDGTRVYDLEFPEGRFKWQDGKVIPLVAQSIPLLDKPLPELKDLRIDLSPVDTNNKMILVCFWDMEQRPSRNCIMRLAKQAQQLKQKGVTVVAVQASKIDENKLNEWVKKNNIPFPIGMVQGDVEKTRFAWGVRSLPWLILTDEEHIVRAEGFGINELDEKITTLRK